MRPQAYDLHVEVDPGHGEGFRGEVAIHLDLAKSTRVVELHAADLRVARARAESDGRRVPGHVEPHPERETVAIRFARPLSTGPALLRLDFSGRLRKDLRGLYAARSGEREYAFTQLEAADARRFFPCFDEPAMKARLRLSVTTSARHTVLSNAPIGAVETLSDGRKTVRFRPTPPLSTYLFALAVGALESSRPQRLGPTEIRVWHAPGKAHLTGFALEAARECLARLEEYFGLPYPYAKLDLVAVPDFEAGAMENAGAVFFRETLLLIDPATVTLTEKKRAAEVICHELAHMWYGDLVTMAWWDDLWLNEAFATWMAFHVVDRWQPDWRMWHDFQHHRAAALRLDAQRHTHPIHTEVHSPADATQNFDLITYEKGASVVRMLERYLGERTFRTGVRAYIRRHRESNATASDLWSALSQAAKQEVEPIVRRWIENAGLPLVTLRHRRAGGRSVLELRQERFHADPRPARRRPRKGTPAPPRWPIPWVGRVGAAGGRTRLVRALVTRSRQQLDLGPRQPRFVYGNADEGGFFRPLHEAGQLALLGANLSKLSVVERMGLLDHQWALARAGRTPIESVLDLLTSFGDEEEPDVLLALRGPLRFLEERLAPAAGPDVQAGWRGWISACFGEQLETLGWQAGSEETDATRLRRAALVSILGEIAASEPVLEQASKHFEAYLADRRSLDPNLADPVVALGARTGGAERFDDLLEASQHPETPQERRRFLMGLAEFRKPRLVDRTLALALTDRVPTQDVAFLVARLLGNPAARERTWSFVKRRWPALRRRMPPMLATRLIEATPALASRAHRRDVAAFFRANPLPAGERALRQALERFDLDQAFFRLAAGGLRRWLAGTRHRQA